MNVRLGQNGVPYTARRPVKFDGYCGDLQRFVIKNKMLPDMEKATPLIRSTSKPEQHFTQPPARYSEAAFD